MSNSNQWRIPSNHGRSEITFEGLLFHADMDCLEWNIHLVAQKFYPCGVECAVVDNFRITLSSVLLSRASCHELLIDLERWLTSYTPFRRILSCKTWDEVAIEMNTPDDDRRVLKSHRVSFIHNNRALQLTTSHEVDETCIRIAADGLATALRILEMR